MEENRELESLRADQKLLNGSWRCYSSMAISLLMPPGTKSKAFTRIELLAIVAALFLMALVVVPAAITNKTDSERLICFNNLRLVGRGVQTWAGDHNQQLSWRTPTGDGGTMPDTVVKPGNAWYEYAYVSNELVTPKILACPSDPGVLRARDWGEFISPALRANATSYALSLDGSMDVPRTWLSADRNLRSDGPGGGCSSRANNTVGITTAFTPSSSNVAWTNNVHGAFGHVLTTDGAVEFTSTERLKELLWAPRMDDNGVTHFLRGRQ
jgi:competence protein ComGC